MPPSVLIGFPTSDNFTIPRVFATDLMDLLNYSYQNKVASFIETINVASVMTERNRNLIAEKAVEGNYSYMLQLDSDMSFSPNVLKYMIDTSADYKNLAVVTGIAVQGAPPYPPAVYEGHDGTNAIWPIFDAFDRRDSFEVDACGGFALLVPREILLGMGRNWFTHKFYNTKDGELREVRHDFAFCKRVKDAGYKIVCNPLCSFDHLRMSGLDGSTWRQHRPPADSPEYLENLKRML